MPDLGMLWDNSGLIVLWLVVLLRIPQVISDRRQRPLWAAVAVIGLVKIFGLTQLYPLLSRVVGSVHTIDIARQTFDIISAALVLYFLLVASERSRRWPLVFGSAAAVLIAMYWIELTAPPHTRNTVGTPQVPLAYWLLEFGFGLVAYATITVTSWRCVRQTEHRSMKAALVLFGTAMAVTTFVYLQYLSTVLFGIGVPKGTGAILAGVTGWCLALSTALPLITAVARFVSDYWTYLRLGSLWRAMQTAAPHIALEEPRSRVGDLASTTAIRLRLYRRIIEIRDGLLVLRPYVSARILERAREYAAQHHIHRDQWIAVTALWIEAARRAKMAGADPSTEQADPDPVPERHAADSVNDEAEWLVQLARVFRSPAVSSFADEFQPLSQ